MMWQFWRQRLAALLELSKLRRRRQKPARYFARFEPLESRRVLSANTIAILPASLAEGNSGTALMSFVATRTGDLNSVVTVEYQTSNSTATSPSDYTATTGNVTFGVGQSSAAVTVPIVGDTTGEENETFQVSLTRVVNTTGANASFGSATNFAANTTVKGIVLADLNGDGRPEAIAINNGSDNLSIFRNTASPGASTASFAANQDVSTQADPISIAVGDLNGDGRLDLIVGNDSSANVSVFLNTTTAGGTTFTFAPAIEFNAASQPRALTVADVNLDGKADVIFTAQSANVMGVLLNTTPAGATTASLATAQTFATPASPVGVASADLNGDGRRDLVVVSSGADSASVFLNNTTVNSSTVQWQTRRDFATGAVPSAVALGDLNGDGRADIVVTNAVGDNVSVLVNETATGNATAAFAAAANFASGNTPRAVALADLNGDGTLDLLVAHQDDQTVTALINRTTRGSGTISLSAAVNTTVGTQPYAIALGDLNGDGKPDVVSGNALSDNISAIINQALWDSTAPTLQTGSVTAATTAQGLASGDLNGDGKPELIATMPGSNALGIFVNSSAGGAASPSFAARQDVALGATPGAVHLADVNADGKLDVIVTTSPNLVTVLLNTTPAGSATISFAASPTTVPLAGLGAEITSGDLNGDGKVDLVVSTPQPNNNVAVLTNTTTPGATTSSFSLTTTGFTSQPHGLLLADLNGDGKLDVIAVNQGSGTAVGSGSTASIRLNITATGAATPSFSSAGTIFVGSGPRSIAALDVNGDGKLDLVTANRVGNNVSVLINAIPTGSSSVAFTRTDFTAGSEPYAIRTADLNGDGRGDLIIGNRSSNQTTILFNTTATGNATPTFAMATSVGSNASRFVSVADFNLDGRPDFAASDASGSGISLFTNTPSTISTPTATGTITNDDAPRASSIVRNSPTAAVTNATALSFAVTFSHAVSGVDPTDFITIGDAIATITNVTGSGASWLVSVEVAGDGSVNLQLVDDDSIVDANLLKLGGTGPSNGDFINNAAAYTIDLTPPTLTPILTPAANGFGWNNTDVQLTFDPSDNLSGVNLASLQGNTTFTNEGIHSPVQGNVADNAGNVTSVMSPTIRIDKTAPTLTFVGTDISPSANGWFRTNVTYTYSASDDSSGIPTQPTPVTVTGEGSNLGFVLTTEDRAGNQGSVTVNGIKIDRTAPTVSRVTSTSANGSYGPGASVNLTIEFSETVSLVGGTLTITLNNGAQVTLAAGSFTNSQTASASYVIQAGQAIANLDVTEVRLDVGAELLDRADNPLVTSSGTLTIPPGQSLGDLKNITILAGQAVQFTIANQIVDETNGTLEVVIELNGAATSQVSIPLTVAGTANGSDYNFVAAPAVIPIGSSQVTLMINLLDDAVAELPETITITLGTPIGAPLGSITQHTVILLDNELPELRIGDASVTEGNSGTRQLTFAVTRLGDLQPALNFNYATQNDTATAPTDFTAITGSGFLDSGATSATITVTINGDTTFEGDESLLVNLTGVSGVIGNTPTFGATSSIVTGNTPLDMATGDFNLDGLPDLVTADFQANGISVHLGNTPPGAATASFAMAQSFALGASPSSIAVTDFNGDGKPDIVAVNRTPGAVLVRLNTTTPGSSTVTFAATQTFSAGTNPAAVAVGDVNRDGLPDVIVANAGSSNVSILRNTTAVGGATAAFAAAQSLGVQASPTSVAVGDLNGDGDVDIVVGNEASDTVSVLFNSTTANSTTFGFAPAGNFAVGTTPRAVAIGDLNNDGRADLVVANRGSNTFSWLRNIGAVGSATPSFDVHQSTIVTTQVVSVLLVDQNLDGKLDVAVTSDNASSVAIFKSRTNPGATTLDLEMLATLSVNSNPEAIVAADFDLDGRPDLATVSGASSNVVSVLNTTELPGATPSTSAQSVSTQTPVGAVSADLNGDGLPEIISANDVPGTISVFRNTATPGGSASFATAQDFSVGSRPLAIVVADVNGDGRPDVAVTNYNASSVSVLINTTAPGATTFTFEPRQALTVPATPTDLVFADLNRDGRADLVVTSRSNNSVNAFINTTVPGDLTVSFGAETNITTGLGPVGVAAADLNGDGLADLAITAYTSGVVSLLRNTTAVGSATASFAAVTDLTSQVGVQGIAIGDFNRDGRADLAVTVRSANLVSVLLNATPIGSGTLSFDLPQDLPTGAQPLAIVVGDLDRDGIVDLATANAGDGTVTRFMNRTVAGDSVVGFLAGSNVSVGSSPRDIALADFNLDGIVDLFAANRSANGVSVAVGQLTTIADANGLGTILDDDAPPVVNFTTTTQSVGENAGIATVVVQLSFVAATTVTIPFSVTAGNATGGGTDYSLSTSPVTIPAGASTAAITITINNDLIVESNETLTISLGTPSGATLGATTSHTLTIVDNDVTPSVSFASASQSVNENVTTTTVVVQLSAVAGQTVTIPFSIGGGSASGSGVDYSLSGSPLTILAGASTAAITVTVNNDLIDEPDETLLLNLGTPTNANLGAVTQHTVTIVDNDPPPVVEFVAATQSVNENATTATVIVRLSTVAGGTVTIPFSVSGGTATGGGVDYTLSASPLTITAGASTGAITLTITNDALDENDETLTLSLGTPSGATVGSVSQSTVTISDDDAPPSVQFTAQSQSLGEASGTSNILAALSAPSAKTVSVPFTVSGTATATTDYSLSGASFLFLPGQTSTFHTITIVNDTSAESNETVILTLGTPSNASLGTNVQQTITILDNDSFPGVTLAAQQSSLAENGGSTTVVATLGFAAPQTVTIQLGLSGSATSGVDYSASTTAIVIPAGQLTGSVAISTLNDFMHEGDESVVIDITSVTGATETGVQQATISITDDAADPFELVGNTLNLLGTSGNDRFEINYGSSTTSFSAVVNGITQSFTATTINIDGLNGSDVVDITLSSLADDASFSGRAGTIASQNYTINLANLESHIVRGNALDSATFNDTGAVQTSYLLPVYAIMQDVPGGVSSQAIGFGNYTANAAGNNDAMFIYGDAGVQNYTSTPTQSTMPVGSQMLIGNNFQKVYAYGMGGADTATYSGSSADETMTALAAYTFVNTASTVQYFDRFVQLTVASNGGFDVGVMYDSAGNDTWTASDGLATFAGATFRNIATGYDRIYAFQYFGGRDTATITGGSANDTLTGTNNFTVLVTPASLLQATGFTTVIVTAGSLGTDVATVIDSAGVDTLVATGNSAELTYANGRRIRVVGFDTVNAKGTTGGVNRRTVTNPLAYTLKFSGTWV